MPSEARVNFFKNCLIYVSKGVIWASEYSLGPQIVGPGGAWGPPWICYLFSDSFSDSQTMSIVMSMVTSVVANLQCSYLSQTKVCGQKWREMSMGGNSAQEMDSLEWNEDPFHFAPEGQFGMPGKMACYTGHTNCLRICYLFVPKTNLGTNVAKQIVCLDLEHKQNSEQCFPAEIILRSTKNEECKYLQ